jgi:hypothetical protein
MTPDESASYRRSLARLRPSATATASPTTSSPPSATSSSATCYSHITAFTHTQLDARSGKVTVHHCVATLSSALGDATRRHRLPYSPALWVPTTLSPVLSCGFSVTV